MNFLGVGGHFWRRIGGIFNSFAYRSLPLGFTVGDNCRISGRARIEVAKGATIICGDGVVLNSRPDHYHAAMGFPVTLIADRPGASISIGNDCRLHGCCMHAWSSIQLGRKCLVAAGAQILDAHGHVSELEFGRLRTQLQDRPGTIKIGDFCWIGLGALILKNVCIREGCIVAAHSVVLSGEYPPYSLIAGVPGKVIRSIQPEDALSEDYPIGSLLGTGRTRLEY